MAHMLEYWLGYLFACFAVGVACLGVTVLLVVRGRGAATRAFLAFYAALSPMVTASLLLAFAESAPGEISTPVREVFRYLESIVGLYGLMLTLPLFVHRVFGVDDPRRERVLIAAVLATLGLQHVTEFALGSTPWDERGDWFEDGALIAVWTYSLLIAVSRRGAPEALRPLANRVFALIALGGPGMAFDLFLGEDARLRLYPLWYCVTSVVVTWTLVRADGEREPEAPRPRVEERWGLSEREAEVADGVARGLSNKEIAAALHISPNTLKTHMRSLFEKAGVRSRFELMARMIGFPTGHHPKG